MTSTTASEVDKRVGAQIRLLRKQNGLSQRQLGEKLGVTFQQIQKYELGSNRIAGERLVKCAEAFGVNIDTLYAGVYDGETAAAQSAVRPMIMTAAGAKLATLYGRLSPALQTQLVNTAAAMAGDQAEAG